MGMRTEALPHAQAGSRMRASEAGSLYDAAEMAGSLTGIGKHFCGVQFLLTADSAMVIVISG